MTFNEAEMTALDRFEATVRRKEMERFSMPSPSGRRTLLRSAEALGIPPEPDTVRNLSGPPMGE